MKTIIIAEAGVNHNGSFKNAKKLVLQAKKCGADFIKFQKFNAENLATKKAKLANYQRKQYKNITQYQMLKKLELKDTDYKKLHKFAKKNKIKFLCSCFDKESLKFLQFYKNEFIKIPSGEINNLPLLKYAGSLKNKVILSTGMSTIEEISLAVKTITKAGTSKKNIYLLHCNSDYPTSIQDVNLKAFEQLKKKFGLKLGYSDHTTSQEVPIIAVAMGAKIIEKHFTLNKSLNGPDHKASFNPREFKTLVENIRKTEVILGKNKKIVTASEKKNKILVRKSLVAKKEIKKGDRFNKNNITIKRPGNGIPPTNFFKIIGKKSKYSLKPDELIKI